MVIVVPVYEKAMRGLFYNTAAVIDADGTYLGKYRKQHIPQVAPGFGKVFFTPGDGGYQYSRRNMPRLASIFATTATSRKAHAASD